MKPLDIIVLIIVGVLFVLVIISLFRRRQHSIGCENCPLNKNCHNKRKKIK